MSEETDKNKNIKNYKKTIKSTTQKDNNGKKLIEIHILKRRKFYKKTNQNQKNVKKKNYLILNFIKNKKIIKIVLFNKL